MATGLGGSAMTPSDDNAWSTYAVSGHDENALSYQAKPALPYDTGDDSPQTLASSPKYNNPQPKTRKSTNQLRNGDASGVSRSNSIDALSSYRSTDAGPKNKASRERLRDMSSERPKIRRKTSKGVVAMLDGKITEGEAQSKWIHRDKLAAIESRELAEMGLRVHQSRSTSRARSARTAKSSIDAADATTEPMPAMDDGGRISRSDRRLRAKSPTSADDAYLEDDDPPRPGTSSGKSRLPVSRDATTYDPQSPTLGQEHARTGSRELHMQKQRLRSQSGTLLQPDADSPRDANGKRLPLSAATKASAVGGARKLSSNSDSSPQRPGTSGRSRPGTRNGVPSGPINRPDGDPPWIDQMYKPDPRLPPDQQILPTHARRMAELQREAEARQKAQAAQGESEFVLVDSEGSGSGSGSDDPSRQSQSKAGRYLPPSQPQLQDPARVSPAKADHNLDSGQWPLKTPTPTKSTFDPSVHQPNAQQARIDPDYSHNRNGTTDSGNGHGGYNLMPAILTQQEQEKAVETQQARLSMRSRTSHHGVSHDRHLSAEQWQENASQAPVHQPVHLNPEAEKKKSKDGCLSCCLVM